MRFSSRIRPQSLILALAIALIPIAPVVFTACNPSDSATEASTSSTSGGSIQGNAEQQKSEAAQAEVSPSTSTSDIEAASAIHALNQAIGSLPAGAPDSVTSFSIAPIATGKKSFKSVTIFFTGQTEANLEVCGCVNVPMGGIAPRASVVEESRSAGESVILLDAGKILTKCTEMDTLRNQEYLKLLGVLHYDGIGLSVADLEACGYEFLKENAENANLPFVSANLKFEDGSTGFWKPYRIVEREGIRFAVIGFSEPVDTFDTGSGVLHGSDAGKALASVIAEVTGQVDYIVATGTLGADQGQLQLQRIAEAAPGLDVLIGAIPGTPERHIGNTRVYTTFPEGRTMGRIDINFFNDGKFYSQMREVKLGKELEREPHIRALLSEFYRSLMERPDLAEKVKPIYAGLPEEHMEAGNAFVGQEACRDCHKVAYRAWNTSRHKNAFFPMRKEKTYFIPECVVCHTTGYGLPTGYGSLEDETTMRNVQCEACHGPGKLHVESEGKVKMTRKDMDNDFCLRCHAAEDRPCRGKNLSAGFESDPKGYFDTIAH